MKKLIPILKNILVFFVIFLSINYLFQDCESKQEKAETDGGIVFLASKNEYNKTETITIEIENNTSEELTIHNECPEEPFNVFHYETSKNEWVQKTSSPDLDCSNAKNATIEPGKSISVPYENWNYDLFSERGRFKIEYSTVIDGKEKTLSSQEIQIVEEGIFKKLAIGLFYRPIYNALIFLISIMPGYNLGLAIILLTIIIRTILLIPSQKAIKSQKKMQEIQPRLEKIKEKYKGDQQKIAMETMAVWKESNANPLGSCLPMLLQFPFLIALYYVIKAGLNPDNTHLLYTTYEEFSLRDINTIFLGVLDLTRVNIYILPLIIGGLQFIQMKLSLARKKTTPKKDKKNEMAIATNMMTYIMPVMIAVFTATLPSGVGIYWGVSTTYGIFQQIVVNKGGDDQKNKEPKVRVIENTNN